MMLLVSLPTELLELIVKYSNIKSLWSLVLANRRLNEVATQYLYSLVLLDKEDGTPSLLWAIERGHIEHAKFLTKSNSPFTSLTRTWHKQLLGEKALLLAAYKNLDIFILDLSISKGVDVKAKDNTGATCLHFAARNGNKRTCYFLIINGIDVDAAMID